MNGRLWRIAVALLPLCCLSAQDPGPQASQQANSSGFHQPSPEAMRQIAEQWKQMREDANAINDLAGNVETIDNAHKLVDLIAAEFSQELPPKWSTRSIRSRIAHAEYESATDPGALIPEQHVADAWNDFLEKIGAPRESYVNAAEIHTMRDTYYVTSQFFWVRGHQNFWNVPNIYAVGQDGKVANGCRAIETLNILWQLANQSELLPSTRELIKKGELWSEMNKNPSKPPAPGSEKSYMTVRLAHMPPNLIEQAALRYREDHGARALNHAIEGLLQELFAG